MRLYELLWITAGLLCETRQEELFDLFVNSAENSWEHHVDGGRYYLSYRPIMDYEVGDNIGIITAAIFTGRNRDFKTMDVYHETVSTPDSIYASYEKANFSWEICYFESKEDYFYTRYVMFSESTGSDYVEYNLNDDDIKKGILKRINEKIMPQRKPLCESEIYALMNELELWKNAPKVKSIHINQDNTIIEKGKKMGLDFQLAMRMWKNVNRYKGNFRIIKFELSTAQSYKELIDELKKSGIDLFSWFPELRVMATYNQDNPANSFDLWKHTLETVMGLPREVIGESRKYEPQNDEMLYLAALLHDIGKPRCRFYKDGDPQAHYYGHPSVSADMVRNTILPRLRLYGVDISIEEEMRLLYYIKFHDDRVSLREKHLKRHLSMPGVTFDMFQNLMELQVANAKAHTRLPFYEERIDVCSKWAGEYGHEVYERIKKQIW